MWNESYITRVSQHDETNKGEQKHIQTVRHRTRQQPLIITRCKLNNQCLQADIYFDSNSNKLPLNGVQWYFTDDFSAFG